MKLLFYFYASAFMFHILLNCVFLIVLHFHTIKDEEFCYWKTYNKCSYWVYVVMMFIFDYKVVRSYYGRLTNASMFNMKFKEYKQIHRPYKIIAIFDMVIVHLLSIVVSIYIVITYKLFSFVFWLALYCVVVSVFLVICIIMDMVSVPDVNLDFYNQKKPKPDIIPANIHDKPLGLSVIAESNLKDNNSSNANSQNMMNSRRALNTSRTGSNITSNMLIKSAIPEDAGNDKLDEECSEGNEQDDNDNDNDNGIEYNDNVECNINNEELPTVITSPEKKPTFGMTPFVSFGNKGNKLIDNKNNPHEVIVGKFNNNYVNNKIDEESIEANEIASKPQTKPHKNASPSNNASNPLRLSKLNRSQALHSSYYFPSEEDEDEMPPTNDNNLNDQSIHINID